MCIWGGVFSIWDCIFGTCDGAPHYVFEDTLPSPSYSLKARTLHRNGAVHLSQAMLQLPTSRPHQPPPTSTLVVECWCRCISKICALFALYLLEITRILINKSDNPIVPTTDPNLDEDIWCWEDCTVDGDASYVKSSFSCTSTQCANFAPTIWKADPESLKHCSTTC